MTALPMDVDGPGPAAFTALPELIGDLSAARSMSELMAVVTRAVRAMLRADGATFVLREGDRCFYAEEDAISPLWKDQRFPMKACISGWCMMHSQTVAVPDILLDARIPIDAYRPTFVRALAMAPVRRSSPLGALGAYWSEPHEPQPHELQMLEAIANSAALSVAYLDLQRSHGVAGRGTAQGSPAPAARSPAPAAGPQILAPPPARFSLRAGLRRNSPQAYATALACVAGATALRFAFEGLGVDRLGAFSAYYPAVLLAAVLGGVGPGVAAAVLSGLFAQWALPPPTFHWSPFDKDHLIDLGLYGLAVGAMLWILHRHRRALGAFILEDARQISLTREAEHRTRNLLSVVQSIVRQSLRAEPETARIINERILASHAHLDFGGPARGPADVRGLLAAELAPFDLSRFRIEADEATPLPSELRSVLALVAHELATNAVKHGALSNPGGRILVTSRIVGGGREIRWTETGGPEIDAPETRGYGSVFLRRLVEGVNGSLTTAFPRGGAVISLHLPLHVGRND